MHSLLVTGGCGFIGTNFIRYIFTKTDYNGIVINLDKLTYAANPENLSDIAEMFPTRYFLEVGDICDIKKVSKIVEDYNVDAIVNFAAESHVDRSIYGPKDFLQTNVVGTFVLLETIRLYLERGKSIRFHQISTDEVFGSLAPQVQSYENSPYLPRSPYSASKASADHFVNAYINTYQIPATISICSNNYGPYQFPEKLIPLMILNMLEGKELPVYGDGLNVRDWLYVEDHCEAIWLILHQGRLGETYNIGGENEWENIKLVNLLCELVAKKINKKTDELKKLIKFVSDRPGHDKRYALNCDKIKRELNWKPKVDFIEGLNLTIDWYLQNSLWLHKVKSGEYIKWIEKNYLFR
ncbi:MAG: dTDP-glucose 4,6-dehydratase [Ignavibacteria bacterium]|nr:dTDP-glucose 4,6-dehydratase [Ignavibacteria bacterium]